ncbi:MAG: ParB N-terminal domain-containing protein [Desulfobacterales bacterium]|nr:ParB N-terminal domain-containing protein [Desulfobacterales bacterium]
MRFDNKIVPLSSIDLSDQTFRITTEGHIVELAESLKLLGLIHPPLLMGKGEIFTVLSGFRRIQAGQYLGWPTLPARIADPETEKLAYAQFAIADNAQQRQLNLIEASRSLNLLSGFYHEPEKLAKAAASLALPGNLAVIKKIQKLCRLPQFVQELIVAGVISLSMALDLEKISQEACTAFAGIFNELRLSLAKQREIFTLVKEIALREEKDYMAILSETEIGRILTDENDNHAQKTSKVRFYLKQRRFPALVEAENKFAEFKRNLSLGSHFELIPPADFEGAKHVIRLHFNSLDELESHQSALAGLIENTHFIKYWSCI